MNLLLYEIGGWFGYLQRPSVVVQLLGWLAIMISLHLALLPHWRRSPIRFEALKLGLILMWSALLGLLGQPFALALFFAGLQGLWILLEAFRVLLLRHWEPRVVQSVYTQVIKPAFFLVAALGLIRRLDNLNDLAVIPLGIYFGTAINLGQLFTAAATLYLLVTASGLPAIWLAWLLQRSLGISQSGRRALELMIRYMLVGIGILLVIDHLGIKGNAILAIAGGLSVGLGFGIKEVFSNFVSGLWLLVEGSVRPGEVLFIDGDPCEVRSLGLRAAVLWRDRDNAELVIPNQTFFTNTTTTYTGSDSLRRSQVLVSAAYRHDPEAVVELLEATASGCTRVLAEPAPKALLLGYGDSAVNYAVRFWIANPMDNIGICSDVAQAIWHAFKAKNIEIPFPQLELRAKPSPGARPGPEQTGARPPSKPTHP
ncbi:mechanosensitive ion channel family protein [Cyanobium sp. Morenito 9A2]|uniref:mechanosensitive ion channel family protein n=1 Tax=Cyanobium sp. Morenito 9A2 TaxID=2823718 RepID=UPI0020CC05F4|nr:mechanosensitive ion channel domain-containing protein [Cyanobium sp. Morenito 9A2]MCP9850143.1 mechanosensitive ion channel [Cyanobium sp. Morenito 9A2]